MEEAHSEFRKTSKMERFLKVINGLKSLSIFEKRFILE